MHALGPLISNNKSFHAGKHEQRGRDRHDHEQDRQGQRVRAQRDIDDVQRESQNVTDNKNCQIGGAVICALVAEILVAVTAAIVHLEIGMQQFSLAAIWAAQSQASPDCWLEGADVLLGQAGVSHGDSYVIVGRR